MCVCVCVAGHRVSRRSVGEGAGDTASFPPAITHTHTHLETPIEHAIIDGKAPVRRGELGKDGQSAGACVDEHSEGLPRRSHRDVDKVLGSHVVDRHRHMVDPVPARTLPSHYNTPRQTRRKTNYTATRPAITRSESQTCTPAYNHVAHDPDLLSDSSSGSRISTWPRCRLIIGILSLSVLPGSTGW